jgi:serine-type D-Ala-D-Ala carboxypeptidase (penicillin-binding protein 5/6)
MIKKKILFILLFLFMPIINVRGEELNLAASAGSAILIESTTGKILYERNAHEKMAPASMTKIMTMLLIMESIDEGKISLDQNINISSNAASMGGSQVFLEPNTQMKANELIKSIAIASANDAAVAMAETISGTTDAFVKKMNEKCKALGCENTLFANVHGLDDPNHYSTAKDMSLIASELLKHEDILKYTSIYEEYLKKPDGSTTWMVNTNKVVCKKKYNLWILKKNKNVRLKTIKTYG